MNGPEQRIVNHDWQRPEPSNRIPMRLRILAELLQKPLMLGMVNRIMRPEEMAILVSGDPPDRIELVIAHNGARTASVAHLPRDPQYFALGRTAIDEIALKDNCTFRMLECPREVVQVLG